MADKNKIEDEIIFKDLLKSPLRLFGWVYPYFFVIIVVIGIFYVKHLDKISFNEVPPNISESTIPADLEMKKGGLTSPIDLAIISNPTQTLLDEGKDLFNSNCMSCHGTDGKGDGPAGLTLQPKPRNFLDNEDWTNGRTFNDLYLTLEKGIVKNGMSAYEYLSPKDRIAIIQYTRSFSDFPKITNEELSELDLNYELSKGKLTANQIPVKSAIELILEESIPTTDKIDYLLRYIENHPYETGASLLNQNKIDLNKALILTVSSAALSQITAFKTIIISEPIELGFKPEIVNLNEEDWNELYQYFRKLSELTI